MPGWLEAVLELLLGVVLFAAWIVFLGWLVVRLGGNWVDRAKVKLAREQAGAGQYGWRPGIDKDGLLGGAGYRSIGRDGQLRRMLVGEYEGRPIRMAEYVYWERKKIPSKHVASLIAIELPTTLPDLLVTHGAAEPGLQTFDLESEGFNRRYQVAGHDERYVSAVIHPRMMEWLLANPVNFRIHGNLIVAFADLTSWTVPATLRTLPILSGIADRIPSFVRNDYGKAVS